MLEVWKFVIWDEQTSIIRYSIDFSPILNKHFVFSQPAEAAQGANHLHQDSAGHSGVAVRQDPLPGYLHEGGGGAEN